MSDQSITLRLSRDDAEVLSEAVRYSEELDEATVDRLLAIITAALAAPAEGPERAATGETITDEMVERGIEVLHEFYKRPNVARGLWEYSDLVTAILQGAAIGGGGEGE